MCSNNIYAYIKKCIYEYNYKNVYYTYIYMKLNKLIMPRNL